MSEIYFAVYGMTFERGFRRILDEISFESDAGQIIGVFGPNGSGKTTLLKCIAGVEPLPHSQRGTVRFRGEKFLLHDSAWCAKHLAYVGSDLRAEFPITAGEAVSMVTSKFEDVENAMRAALCWGLRDRALHDLSGGEKQLVLVARAIAQGAKVLLFDETLSKMDINHQAQIGKQLQNLKAQGYLILLVSHDINLATEWADSVLLLRAGKKLAFGKTGETITEENLRKLYPEGGFEIFRSPTQKAPKVFLTNKT